MQCSEFSQVVDLYLDRELAPDEGASLLEHATACQVCGALLASGVTDRQRLRDAVRDEPVPTSVDLDARIRRSLDASDLRARRRRVAWALAAAAGVSIALVGTTSGWRAWRSYTWASRASERHARRPVVEFAGQSPNLLNAWASENVAYAVQVPPLRFAAPVGARLIEIDEEPAVYVRFRAGGEEPADEQAPDLGLLIYHVPNGPLPYGTWPEADVRQARGFDVASWRTGDVVYQLISNSADRPIREYLPVDFSRGDQRSSGD